MADIATQAPDIKTASIFITSYNRKKYCQTFAELNIGNTV